MLRGESESESEDDSESESDGDESDSHVGLHEYSDDGESGSDSEDENDEEMDVDEQKHGKPKLPATDVGTTLFVRNVPFEATEDELRTM